MSWSDTLRGAGRWVVLLALGPSLGGCFTPLYIGTGTGGVGDQLRAVAIDPVPDQLGHYLQDQLVTDFNGTGAKVTPRYHLQLRTSERVQTALVDVTTQRADSATVVTDVNWQLLPMDGGPPVASGTTTSAASYDRSAQRFADIRAARDAEIRNARTLADLITQQVAAKLRSLPASP